MDKKYQPHLFEAKINSLWENAKAFTPSTKKPKKDPFTIILPPPNANDPLHVGHAMYALEDVLIRYHRMLGDDTLWLPGVDHAGIETQFVFEKKLQKKGQSRFDFDRDTLYRLIWDYVQENADIAKKQLKRLGFSLDWSRFKYTLDDDIIATVNQTFLALWQKKLVYRDLRLINYCPKCGTAFSDLEVKYRTQKTPLYYLKYGPFTLATTRPETKFGDTAVAVHPNDQRYQKYIGQTITAQGINGPFQLKVIADDYVDPDFGTGVVKITPAHDHHDYEVWQRHKDEIPGLKQVIDYDGRLTAEAGPFVGLKSHIARPEIIKALQALNLVEKIDDQYQTQIACCYRCQTPLEPLPRTQFFVKVAPLTKPIITKLEQKEIKVYGAGHDKILHHWLVNLRDWNISRQIVWGIRMPIWYHAPANPQIKIGFLTTHEPQKNSPYQVKKLKTKWLISGLLGQILTDFSLAEVKAGLQSLDAPLDAQYEVIIDEKKADLSDYIQETDTFDTWFSSSQWPFATLMNTKKDDFARFYPTTVMETGYDILPFWVMRMLMMGYFRTQKLPFTHIYLHGLVRDQKGQKMSKSKGNVINPLEVVEKYGADALRFALIVRSSAGLDKSIGEGDFKAGRNLTNKLWNAARFSLRLLAEQQTEVTKYQKDQNFSQQMKQIVTEVSQALTTYKIGLSADLLYDKFWHFYCDQAIEDCKKGLLSPQLLISGLITFLKLWHPFIPFVTEQIWQEIKKKEVQLNEEILALSTWPVV